MITSAAPETFDPTTAWEEPPGMGRALTISVAFGMALSFLGVGGAFLAAGQGWGNALGMGAFVALWGGLGFGGMVGGVIWATRTEMAAERARHEAATATSVATAAPAVATAAPVGTKAGRSATAGNQVGSDDAEGDADRSGLKVAS